jgi:hypothetical protein
MTLIIIFFGFILTMGGMGGMQDPANGMVVPLLMSVIGIVIMALGISLVVVDDDCS